MPKPTPDYDYESKLSRTAYIRLQQVAEHDYVLQFTTSRTSERGILGPVWHTVCMYVPTYFPSTEPGTGCPDRHYGNWVQRPFFIESKAAGDALLASLRDRIDTVADIYRIFIAEGERRMAEDMEAYRKYVSTQNALPEIFDDVTVNYIHKSR